MTERMTERSQASIDEDPSGDGGWIDLALDQAILRCDHAGRVLDARGPAGLLPVDRDLLIGRRVADIDALPAPMRHAWSTAVERCLDTQRAQIAAYALDREGSPRAFEARVLPLDGGMAVIAVRDVGERNLLRERVEYLALHDGVTGLGNIRALRERLAAWLPRDGVASTTAPVAAAVGVSIAAPVALLIVDLDRFKQNNDLHGRSIGDSLLRLAAQRMQREAIQQWRGQGYDAQAAATPTRDDRLDDPLAAASIAVVRLGGDQFAIAWRLAVRPDASAADQASALATRLIAALGAPTRIAGQTLFVRASIGIALFPDDGRDASSLFSQAEAALKRAKQAGRNQYRRHGDDATTRAATLPPNTEASMREALAARQFLLVYQPKFELASSLVTADADGRGPLAPGAVIAVEALCRWRTPSGLLLIPQDFIPLAETSGMIRPLGDWVLRQALFEASGLAASGAEPGQRRVGVAVNVSLSQLHDRLFVDVVRLALRDHGFEPDELTLEIAETSFVEDIRLVSDVVAELSAMGVRFAIDHFGVGTGGLVALKSLPIDEIKIDRSLIAGAAIDAFDATIVAGLIAMAHDLGKTVTAEGVERVEQIAALAKLRCDAIQGYFIGEPMTAAELVTVDALWRKRSAPARP
jgi:predicted signal transduction protein with EAL and GGDEF domain